MNIDNIVIGEEYRCFIIAELSANHGNDINIAKRTIKAAKESGADAIKIQTYTPDTMTIDCDNEYFKINQGTIWDGKYLYDLYKEAYTPWEWQSELKEYANSIGLVFFSTPFDKTAVDFLENINVPAYKVASFEITDIPLIEYIASKQKPIIISTGIATIDDIKESVEACKRNNNNNIILLKCTSSYPAKLEDSNLKTISDLKQKFNVITGLSDHSIDIEVPLAAVALGAKVIEKHFILDKNIGGPDSSFSLEPHQFKEMVNGIRKVEKAMGNVDYELDYTKNKNRELSRSLFIVEDMEVGDVFTYENIKSIRPGFGLHPKYYNQIIGKKVSKNVKKGTPLNFDFIDGFILRLRYANKSDCELLFNWINDESVRKNSLNQNLIDINTHKHWFNSKIKSDNSKIFIIVKNDIDVGQIRIDINNNIGIISYSVDYRYRKMGIGEFALNEIKKEFPQLQLLAIVKKENIASIRAFQKANYKQINSGEIIKFLWNQKVDVSK